jgi:hypothetical protein
VCQRTVHKGGPNQDKDQKRAEFHALCKGPGDESHQIFPTPKTDGLVRRQFSSLREQKTLYEAVKTGMSHGKQKL